MDLSKDRDGIEQPSAFSEAKSGVRSTLGCWPIVLLWAVLLTTATAVRLSPWALVFSADGVRYPFDTDPYYHVLRAQRIVQGLSSFVWRDPFMNYPAGAPVLWPPLFDYLIAWPAKLLGGTPATVERVAAVVPVLIGVATLPLMAALGALLVGWRAGFLAAGLLAVLPAHVKMSALGRPDQHVLEFFLSCWVFAAFLKMLSNQESDLPRWTLPALLGLGITLSFWNWQGSAFYLLVLAAFVSSWHVLSPQGAALYRAPRALAMGTGVGAGLLWLSLFLFAPQFVWHMSVRSVTGFHALLVSLTAIFASELLLLTRFRMGQTVGLARRIAEVFAAATIPGVLVMALVPGFRASVSDGLAPLLAANSWYSAIGESRPMLFAGFEPLPAELRHLVRLEYGYALFCMPLCLPALVSRWRTEPDHRLQFAFVTFWGTLLLILTLARSRFALYLLAPTLLWLVIGFERFAIRLQHSWLRTNPTLASALPVVAALGILAPTLPSLLPTGYSEPADLTRIRPALEWLRGASSPIPQRQAVLADWDYGHHIQYLARKPVIATPFGTDIGESAMEDTARFYFATDPKAAEAVLERRRVAFVLLSNPIGRMVTLSGFAPEGTTATVRGTRDWWAGGRLDVAEAFWQLPVARLYFVDGSSIPHRQMPALAGFRLLYETPSTNVGNLVGEFQFKLFGVLPGANVLVRHARPRATIWAVMPIQTNQGRTFRWIAFTQADGSGSASLAIPYATGLNGQVRAFACNISDGGRERQVALLEKQVVEGETVVVDFLATGNLSSSAPTSGNRG